MLINFFSKKGEFLFCKDYNIKTVITTCHNFTLTWYTCTHFLPDFIHLSKPLQKTVGLYVLEIPKNKSIHRFYLKTLDRCQFYQDQHSKSTDLGPISLLIVKYFNLSMTVLYQIQAQFLKFVLKKKKRERKGG